MLLQDQSAREEIQRLKTLERSELISAWIRAYGAPPFKGIRQTTLIRGLAYHIQCKRFGNLKPSVNRQLLKIVKPDTEVSRKPRTTSKPKTMLGSQIIREWNGRTHTVQVTDKGYVMAGITYGSLSAAAKAITGSHWSGPRFFGVRA